MTKNVGTADKIVRVVVSLGLATAAYKSAGLLAVVLWIFAAVILLTALLGWCWLYALLGIRTSGAGAKPADPGADKPQ